MAPQTVTIQNNGGQSITLVQPISASYDISAISPLTLGPGASLLFTIQPKTTLRAGNYDQRIMIRDTGGSFVSIPVEYTVVTSFDYRFPAEITTPATGSGSFGTLQPPYAIPAVKTITLRNTGNYTVTLEQPNATNFTIGALSSKTLTRVGQTNTVTFTVLPKADLEPGDYLETITINGDNGTSAFIEVSLSVLPPHTFEIIAMQELILAPIELYYPNQTP